MATDLTSTALEAAKKAKPDDVTDPKGLAAVGAALIALPYAAKGVAKLVGANGGNGAGKAAEVGRKAKGKAATKAKEAAKDVAGEVADDKLKQNMPNGLGRIFGGGGDEEGDEDDGEGGGSAAPGHGSGRRMPIQQAVDVAVPIKTAYNLWTEFEEWPKFMHRVEQVDQVDDDKLAMTVKVWGISKRFEAQIVEQRPDERIEWDVEQGLAHTGVVTFHKLAPSLTRVDVSLDINPDSLLEKAGRGMRFSKRAVRGDLHRFKAHAEINAEEPKGWRGTITDGKVRRKTDRPSKKRSRSKSSGSK